MLRENGLVGSLPDASRQLSSLEVLHVPGTSMSSALPSTLGKLAALKELGLWGNRLAGAIPREHPSPGVHESAHMS